METSMPPKRSTPKIMHRAAEMRKQPGPAETKLWAYLRALREDGIHFRRHTVLAVGARGMPSVLTLLTFPLTGPCVPRAIN
jgi:hypothetical protein